MQEQHINALLVVNDTHQIIGAFNMHMLLQAGVV
jgi:hypothetical protein